MRRSSTLALALGAALALVFGCEVGELTVTGGSVDLPGSGVDTDGGAAGGSDGAPGRADAGSAGAGADGGPAAPDAGGPEVDAGPGPEPTVDAGGGGQPPPDAAAARMCPGGCGENARCADDVCVCLDGFVRDGADCVPADPCAIVQCAPTARCDAGACVCRDGFVDDGAGNCTPAELSPLEARSRDEVCTRWSGFSAPRTSWSPTPGSDDPCDPGTVPADAQDAAIARTNLYRWLVGLPPVGLDAGRLEDLQACAALMDALNALTHRPSPDMPCYTDGAARGAGSSNLALGGSLTGSVDLFVADNRVPSLGHRRWVVNPGMAATAFGHKGRATCMYSFSMGGPARPDYIAWPPPGWVPVDAADGQGSVTLHALRAGPDFRIEAAIGGEPADVGAERLGGNYGGGTTYAFALPAGHGRDGAEMQVALRGLRDAEDVVWTTRWTACP